MCPILVHMIPVLFISCIGFYSLVSMERKQSPVIFPSYKEDKWYGACKTAGPESMTGCKNVLLSNTLGVLWHQDWCKEARDGLSAAVTLLKRWDGYWLGLRCLNQNQDFLGCGPATSYDFLCYLGHIFKFTCTRFSACQNGMAKSSYPKSALCLVAEAVTGSCPTGCIQHIAEIRSNARSLAGVISTGPCSGSVPWRLKVPFK